MRLVFDIDEDIIRAGYIASMEAKVNTLGSTTFEEFREKIIDFDIWGIVDESPVGIIIFDGNCAHISILKEYYGKCGFVIHRALKLALKKYGSLIALIRNDDKEAESFNIRLGFYKIGHTNDYMFYYRS